MLRLDLVKLTTLPLAMMAASELKCKGGGYALCTMYVRVGQGGRLER